MATVCVKTLNSAIDLAGRGFYESAFQKLNQCGLSETQHAQIKAILAKLSLDTPPTAFSYGRQQIFCVFRNHSWFEYDPSVPFPHADLFTFAMEFLEVRDILSIAQVCKLWSDFSNDGRIWKRQSKIEGIPQVRSSKGRLRNPKADFIKLQPMTISGKMISQYLGEFVGDIPCIDGKYVDVLEEKDPFEKGKLKETFVFVVEPHFIKRFNDKEPPTLRKDGDLITCPSQANEREILLPFSLTNLVILANNPLDGTNNMPVVSNSSCPEALRLCNARTEKVGVYFMRKQCVKWSMGIPLLQNQWLGREGFEMVSLRVRALFDFILILKTGTCPDAEEQQPFNRVRTSDVVRIDGIRYHAAVCDFAPKKGICITYYTTDQICVVPCMSVIGNREIR